MLTPDELKELVYDLVNGCAVEPCEVDRDFERALMDVQEGAEATGRTRPKLLDGDTNWPAVMKALDAAGYSGWAISEQPSNQAADVETAHNLAQRMDRIFAL